MKIYIIIKDDIGYLGCECNCDRYEIESIHKSFDDACQHIKNNFLNAVDDTGPYGIANNIHYYRWYCKNNDHVYELVIHEKELA